MSVDDQMHAMLGGDRFEEQERLLPPKTRLLPQQRRSKLSAARVAVGVVVVSTFGFATCVLREGLLVRAEARAQDDLAQLDAVASQGATEHAVLVADSLQAREHLPAAEAILLARTEAILFRFRDAAPDRLEHIVNLLARDDVRAHERQVAVVSALLSSRRERAAMLDRLLELERGAGEDPEPSYLVATAYAQLHDAESAAAAFERSLEIEPSHLEHLYVYAAQQLVAGNAAAAAELLEVMREANPSSPWTRMLALRIEPDAEALGAAPPVVLAWRAIAEDDVERAVELVHADPAFLIDFADTLIATGRLSVARRLVAHERWPDGPHATRLLADLDAAERFVVGKVRIKAKQRKRRRRRRR